MVVAHLPVIIDPAAFGCQEGTPEPPTVNIFPLDPIGNFESVPVALAYKISPTV